MPPSALVLGGGIAFGGCDSLSLSVRVVLVAGVEGASGVVVISSGGDCDHYRKDGTAWRCA